MKKKYFVIMLLAFCLMFSGIALADSKTDAESAELPATEEAAAEEETAEAGEEAPEEEEGIRLFAYAEGELPQIYIETKDGMPIDDPSLIDPDTAKGVFGQYPAYNYIDAEITVTNCEGYELTDVPAQVKVRGNSTSENPKRPIRIKFEKKQAMCGLNGGAENKSWVLLAMWNDSSKLRNAVMQYTAHSLFSTTGQYATDFRYTEVYMNGEYYGLFLLVEQQQTGKSRVNIPEPEDPADYDLENLFEEDYERLHSVKTGYFFELDTMCNQEAPEDVIAIRYDPIVSISGVERTPRSVSDEDASYEERPYPTGFTIKSDHYFEEQRLFLQDCVQCIWDVLYDAMYQDHTDLEKNPYHTMSEDGEYVADPSIQTAEEAVASVVDVDTLVDMYLLQELSQNPDCGWSSFYFTLDMSEEGSHLLTYTAPWDFDLAFGSYRWARTNDKLYIMDQKECNPWVMIFCGQDWFWKKTCERWTEAKEAGVFSGAIEMIDKYTADYQENYERDYERWSDLYPEEEGFVPQEEESATIRAWLGERIEKLDSLLQEKAEGEKEEPKEELTEEKAAEPEKEQKEEKEKEEQGNG